MQTFEEHGSGRPVLLLHGGGGPQTVTPFGVRLAAELPAHVVVPTHPGFGGTPRPDDLTTIAGLSTSYADLLDRLDLDDVLVIGNSIGGWIAAELALLDSPRVTSLVIVDGVGLQVPGHPVADFISLTFPELAELSYYNPDAFRIDPTQLPPAAQAQLAGNRAALAVYAATMEDPTLQTRLAAITVPTTVIWGDSDRIADAVYGRAYADAIPDATFELLENTGHLPQLESPDLLLKVLSSTAGSR
ncbi:alpha/beta fold hydrolase [Kribbella pratensis]|uniref:Pimeloyl-ACP methyl ester carboxylesterase n=1 Tax=Kribbella pratensis TaxID=2512112 RepID=A0A4R8C9E7_9ACTN|nr:alpha/beta hydrolase [Kribbella pratensis]TDW70103.1 pimeloyl-ACP methyl ester carboxylesterase [Kribbella pratensis]